LFPFDDSIMPHQDVAGRKQAIKGTKRAETALVKKE
jgi:hypothetical protein